MNIYHELFHSKDDEELGDRYFVNYMFRFEKALLRSQVDGGLVPKKAWEFVCENIKFEDIDLDLIIKEIPLSGNAAIPFVKQLNYLVKKNGADKSYFHLGATSQDLIDTCMSMMLRDKIEFYISGSTRYLRDLLVELTNKYRNTVMIGRTLMQHAIPITFGLKAAKWMISVSDILQTILNEKFSLTLGGAAGSDNQYINDDVRRSVAASLGLDSTSWHENNDFAKIATHLGLLQGVLSKIAKDISLLSQTEIGELSEGNKPGKGGSSTMPHKRNPVLCTAILANSIRVPHLVATMLSCMTQENERSAGAWHAQWEVMYEIVSLVSDSLVKAIDLILNLQVFPEKMKTNLDATKGLIFSERIALTLADQFGKDKAHELLEQASDLVLKTNKHLKEVLTEMGIQNVDFTVCFDLQEYVVFSNYVIDQILKQNENLI